MNRLISNQRLVLLLFTVLTLSFGASIVIAGDPFAPKINVPEDIDNRDMWVQMANSWEVPSKAAVGFPAYPGSFIVALAPAGTVISNDDTLKTLPSLTLVTEDEQAKVVAFYKDALKDWKYKNSYDMFDIFWIGPDDFNNMDVSQAMTIPNLVVFESITGEPNFMPEAKTAITIVYEPKE